MNVSAQTGEQEAGPEHPVKRSTFLKDVLICSLGAYGGPEAHYSVFLDQLVARKKYLTENELVELIALCSILPGPTSTQTIIAVGHKTGGPLLAFLTMLVWALPVLTAMTALSFLYQFLAAREISDDILRFIGPMAVGFIIVATFRIGKKVVNDTTTALLLLFGAATTWFLRDPWIFPVVLITGGLISILVSRESDIWNRVRLNPPWRYFIIFAAVAFCALIVAGVSDNRIVQLFEHFYRYGYLVFGGGQVVIPLIHSELVQIREYLSNEEFLTGYGLVQGLPGPMFSFAAYAGGMAARDGTALLQIGGAMAGGIGIFLPGLLLIYFVYPVWEQLKQIHAIRISLKGINAVAGGLIASAAIILMQASGFQPENIIAVVISVILLASGKIPAPLIVVAALVAGVFV
ncbi:chromate efflux transporter [Natronogracilivirga saccharolytica]|uniref:Chromate efflux transporter n=1 Tax=Natronogracilivirga saccharolytica TaxID=2812953 RepID=A0A8J7S4D3_9BACT|nr:chromate efflux transporter [Natronogracilivirga saccharolytica]MBP3191758.1 chromate efflux transporter [Natronogracilivirga saccharolytica]